MRTHQEEITDLEDVLRLERDRLHDAHEQIDRLERELHERKVIINHHDDELNEIVGRAGKVQVECSQQLADIRASIRTDDFREMIRALTAVGLTIREHYPALKFETQSFGEDDARRHQIKVRPNYSLCPAFRDMEITFVFDADGRMLTMLAAYEPNAIGRLSLKDAIGKISTRMKNALAAIEQEESTGASWMTIVGDSISRNVCNELELLDVAVADAQELADKACV